MGPRFEKWQALGNDYVIVERDDLPFELTPARVRRICEPHLGVGSDGILLLSKPAERGFVADLQIFNPDGSEAELSGNGAREAIMYLRHRGWTDSDTFSIKTAAGEIRPTITGADT
ncbi:MAG: diaminopimelate epimerase, partial [Thermoleophilaceae bacterium]|nr:diaminopimelate epimerase [Thermoleophilaceae bacterium]